MAAADYFLKINGIKGDSPDATHRDEIRLASWSWGGSNASTMQFGGTGGDRAQMDNLDFTMSVNRATPKLVEKLASGEAISSAVLTCRKAGALPHEYLKITFEDVVVASYRAAAVASEDTLPEDAFSLNFAKVRLEYSEQNADGTLGTAVVIDHDMRQAQSG